MLSAVLACAVLCVALLLSAVVACVLVCVALVCEEVMPVLFPPEQEEQRRQATASKATAARVNIFFIIFRLSRLIYLKYILS